ncbi:MAG: hypothetical protein LQ343_000999 [Gyalolechia ehrenbergii]|nr:MAG: hypothetical protein LQ343_000999 [Gyalolechia ehrenbergii]
MSPISSSEMEELRQAREEMARMKLENEDSKRREAQAEQRAQKAELVRQQEQQRADQAMQRADQEMQRADHLQKLTQPSTFEELLQICHEQLFRSFTVQTDKTLTTKGGTTDPTGKIHPVYLQQWADFPERLQKAFDHIYGALYTDWRDDTYRLFLSQSEIQGLRKTQPASKAASEMDLRLFQNHSVESVVTNVIKQLSEHPDLCTNLGLGGTGITFENHANSLRDGAADVRARQQSASSTNNPPVTPPNQSTAAIDPNGPVNTQADQLCVYHTFGGRKRLLFVMEYKAPHKFTKLILRQGFRDMNVAKDVINRGAIPQDDADKFRYLADYLVAAASTQTYAYMLESKCEYGCIITGESIVFLRVTQKDPHKLEYRLTEPGVACEDMTDGFQYNQTAIAQMLSFFFMALECEHHTNDWMKAAEKGAPRWEKDVAAILAEIPATIRKSPPLSPPYEPPGIPKRVVQDSPFYQRRQLRRRAKLPLTYADHLPKNPKRHDDPDDSDSDAPDTGTGKHNPKTPITKTGNRQGGGKQQSVIEKGGNWQSSESDGHYYRAYCTQKCILGLAQRSALDPNCPHVESHRRGGSSNHTLDRRQVCTLLQQQLNRSLDFNCTDLQTYGSRSMLFKVTLASHGYTLIAKGTRDVFVVDLKHEQQIYNRLSSMQGKYIPVHLGNIDLAHPWYDCGGVRVIHMLLLAYGGIRIDQVGQIRDLWPQVTAFEERLAWYGVQHGDLEDRNILWNTELQRIMFIDFERSTGNQQGGAFREVPSDQQQSEIEPAAVEAQPKLMPCWLDIFDADESLCLRLPSAQEQHADTTITTADPTILSTCHDQTVTHPLPPLDDKVGKEFRMATANSKGLFQSFKIYEDPGIASPPSPAAKEPFKGAVQRTASAVTMPKDAIAKKQTDAIDKENVVASVHAP